MDYDAIVIGLGGMGSATAFHLACEGKRVLGLERFPMAHALGSSHGLSRLIRKAYFEEPRYVPLLEQAYALWDALQTAAAQPLLHRVGLLVASAPEEKITLAGIARSAETYGLHIEKLGSQAMRERFPVFQLPDDYAGIFESEAGFLLVEECIRSHCRLAIQRGAQLQFEEKVMHWSADAQGVRVPTEKGEYEARHLVVTAGPWAGEILKQLKLPITVHRVPQFWYKAPPTFQVAAGCPCFAFVEPLSFVYGFPAHGDDLVKVAFHAPGAAVAEAHGVDRSVHTADELPLQRTLTERLPGISPVPALASVCMYSMTPDEHFWIDQHPQFARVFYAAGFSGHGFKFASVVGKYLASRVAGAPADPRWNFLQARGNSA